MIARIALIVPALGALGIPSVSGGQSYDCSGWPLGLHIDLEEIICDAQDLTGPIPPILSQLVNLTKIDLQENELNGTVPDLSGLSKLSHLDLKGNRLGGTLPKLGESVEHLSLGSNEFIGQIPHAYGELLEMTYLAVDSNELSGHLLPSLGNLTKLLFLSLSENLFIGNIPQTFESLTQLHTFAVDHNSLSGCASAGLEALCDDFGTFRGTGNTGCYVGHQSCEDEVFPLCSSGLVCTPHPTTSPTKSPTHNPSVSPTSGPSASPNTPSPSQAPVVPTDAPLTLSGSTRTQASLWLVSFLISTVLIC